ncbi:cytochrome P450 [Lentzea flava]|uniref:Cytochrome P450 n=1 Tax=Lentzea flava TaxID=103732 RepID=A0ABQ2VE00_9PSEU|nr:cytochrome P450 [Lentzea flava]GGU81500.1 cytochrome P450 [Lentzea flava]
MLADPYPVYARYRRHDPVHWGAPYSPDAKGCWYLFRHEDVVAVLKDRRFRREWPEGATAARRQNLPAVQRPFWDLYDQLLLSTDPPEHRRLRALVATAFSAHSVETYRPMVFDVASRLSATLPADFDVVEDYAAQLSFTVICTLLGVPLSDSARLREWIARFAAGLDLRKGDRTMYEASCAARNLLDYFGAVVASRRSDPAGDLITAMVEARDGGDALTDNELLAMCVQLLFAGHETTTGQISITLYNLLREPDQLALVRREPELVPAAVHESLRLNGSVQTAAARKPIEDVSVGGRLIRTGEPVIAFLGAANRDPAVFPNPDVFELSRDHSATIAFGAGIHHCLGARLARLEVEAGVARLVQARPTLRLRPDASPQFRTNVVLPGLSCLPVSG